MSTIVSFKGGISFSTSSLILLRRKGLINCVSFSIFFFELKKKKKTCSEVLSSPYYFLNCSIEANLSGSIKLSSVHNSSTLFWIGVPVSSKYRLQGNSLNIRRILFLWFLNRCASSIAMNWNGIESNQSIASYENTS